MGVVTKPLKSCQDFVLAGWEWRHAAGADARAIGTLGSLARPVDPTGHLT